MEPRFNLWIEIDGHVALSIWRVELLNAIAETGSISAAAERMDVDYRVAWQKIHEMESALGDKLVETKVGGSGGGGATLTSLGEVYVDAFSRYRDTIGPMMDTAFHDTFDDLPG